ncbi:alpha/beta hydrolase family protein [Nafulsella turpanensis]|uniref:alpha/beta hydrolase family protein n=1 Tax=Nafulsella turpanensis TaxID=1265690 RepID=UPI00034B4CD7|nr:alpha/beta fold hydrolase [Nafulsella turpanensis]
MKKFNYSLFFSLLLLVLWNSGSLMAQSVTGSWQGNLSFRGSSIPLLFHLNEEEGKLQATVDSPAQGAKGLPVDSVLLKGDSLILRMTRMGVTYSGKLSKDADSLSGHWKQGGFSIPLIMEKKEVVSLQRPQEPSTPLPYLSQEVNFENKAAGIKLAGTFTRPSAEGQYPAVVLVSGSGPQDRNEQIMGHQPFLVLADYLTRQGFAVLRYDDRGFGQSEGAFIKANTEDFASDAAAAVDYLQYRPDVKAKHIGLIGHSEGGIIAPMVAAKGKPVSFIVMLAGPALPGHELILEQGETLLRQQGATPTEIESYRKAQGELLQVIRNEKDSITAAQQLEQLLLATYEQDRQASTPSSAQVKAQVAQLLSPWYRYFITYDPAPLLRQLEIPTLALFGGKDVQVPAKANIEALRAIENENIELKSFPQLNHLFQPATTGLPNEYGQIATTIDPLALEYISSWIEAQVPDTEE